MRTTLTAFALGIFFGLAALADRHHSPGGLLDEGCEVGGHVRRILCGSRPCGWQQEQRQKRARQQSHLFRPRKLALDHGISLAANGRLPARFLESGATFRRPRLRCRARLRCRSAWGWAAPGGGHTGADRGRAGQPAQKRPPSIAGAGWRALQLLSGTMVPVTEHVLVLAGLMFMRLVDDAGSPISPRAGGPHRQRPWSRDKARSAFLSSRSRPRPWRTRWLASGRP